MIRQPYSAHLNAVVYHTERLAPKAGHFSLNELDREKVPFCDQLAYLALAETPQPSDEDWPLA